jgi:NADH:ubiquinone oxidoreductase subunit E
MKRPNKDVEPKEMCGAVLVMGAGIAGIQASLDLASAGFRVYIVENSPTIGGNMSRLDKTFPTGDCAVCTISPKLVECMRNYNIDIITMADLVNLEGDPGDFHAKIRVNPRSVDSTKCTGCNDCTEHCPVRNVPQPVPKFKPTTVADKNSMKLLDEILGCHKTSKNSLIPILQDINDKCGYLSREMLENLSVKLDVPLTEILRVASFYNAFSFEPVGRHIIEVCMGTACFVQGSGVLLEHIEETINVRSGGTDKDMRFTLRPVRCLGCCALAPAMRIDGITFGKMKMNKISKILEQFK